MQYEDIISTLSEIVENDKIFKTGLTLVYALTPVNHRQMNEHLFYKSKPPKEAVFVPQDEFEVEIDGILIKFVLVKK